MSESAIPFSVFPNKMLRFIASKFTGLGANIKNAFPYLEIQLKQADLDYDAEEYTAIMAFLFVFYAVFFSIALSAILVFFTPAFILLAPTIGLFFAFMVLIQLSLYPKILISRKVREIDRNLVFAMRTMLIQIKSGVSLFQAINIIARGEYGILSREFRKAIDKINSGYRQELVIQDMAANNPSPSLRKALWQIVNGLSGGSDVSTVLQETVNSINRQQRIEIQKYGSQLRVLSLIYMMIGVIIPALGLTFLTVIGSFPRIGITEEVFWALLGVVVLLQFMYIGFIKSRRPTLMGA